MRIDLADVKSTAINTVVTEANFIEFGAI